MQYLLVPMQNGRCLQIMKIPKSECPDIWMSLPRLEWANSWANIEDPVVLLERIFFGHPLAVLLWERQFEKALIELGWEKVPIWECLFVHRKQKLFQSVHVDDIKMAGKKQTSFSSYVEEINERC